MCDHDNVSTNVLEGQEEVWITLTCQNCGRTVGEEICSVEDLIYQSGKSVKEIMDDPTTVEYEGDGADS